MELWLPYGRTEIPVRVPDDNFYRIIEPKKTSGPVEVGSLIEKAIDDPIGGLSLKEMVRPGSTAGIVLDPAVPPVARNEAVRVVTSRLSSFGVEKSKVFIRNRLSDVDGPDVEGTRLNPAQNSFSEIGKTAMGTSVELDSELLSCDVKLTIGIVMPHFAAGFTGGPDAVVPSASSNRSITKNRSLLVKGFTEPQNLSDNLVLKDSLEAARFAGPVYSVCLQPDGWGGIDSVIAGELEAVFRRAVSRFMDLHSPRLERKLDIIVVSAGKFLGSDLYHAVRVVSNVLPALKRGGTIILVAECSRGIGDSTFLEYARKFREPKELSTELRHRFRLGGHVNLYIKEVLEKCRIQLVSVLPEVFVHDTFDLKPSQTASEALVKAIRVEGRDSKILIVPRGDVTIPVSGAIADSRATG